MDLLQRIDEVYLSGPSCRGCLSPVGRGRRRWCSQRCASYVKAHPSDFTRLFRRCRHCGVEIDHLPLYANYCDLLCWRGDRRADRVVSCQVCKADLPVDRPTARYCSTRCGEIARGQRFADPLPARVCALPECARTFQPKRRLQRCCCEKHGKLLYNRESRADGRQQPPPWTDARRDRYHRRRAQKKATSTGAPVLLEAIAERDRWRCHICRTRVGKKILWPSSRSASLDHVVPLSHGGAHEPANVRLAHLGCNSARNNRGGGEQLLLIG